MQMEKLQQQDWNQVKRIYREAFPKSEQKPFFALKRSVKKGKMEIHVAKEGQTVLGFAAVIPYGSLVMVDYLAVNRNLRSRGTGSGILQGICRVFADRRILLLIERPDPKAGNQAQRIARRRFYQKNGFSSAGLFPRINGGDMEVLCYGGEVSERAYLTMQKYALGTLFFRLARIRMGK